MTRFSSLFTDFILKTKYEELPAEVVLQTKQRILDLIGVSLAGYSLMESAKTIVNYMASLGGSPEATMIQMKRKFPGLQSKVGEWAVALQ